MSNETNAKTFSKGFDPIPAQDYLVRMTSCEEVATKNGKGRMLKSTFQVVNGDHKNRLIFDTFLVEHTNENVQRIGNERLDRYLKSVGVPEGLDGIGQDRTQVENYLELPFIASVKIEPGKEYIAADGSTKMGSDQNRITSFKTR